MKVPQRRTQESPMNGTTPGSAGRPGRPGLPGFRIRVASALYSLTAQLIFQVNTDDLVERAFCGETQSGCRARIEPLRPGGHDFFDRGVELALDEGHCLITGDSPQSSQLIPDCR